ncbi:hypothetical protein ACFQVA_27945 [Actinomadura keratinilytica]
MGDDGTAVRVPVPHGDPRTERAAGVPAAVRPGDRPGDPGPVRHPAARAPGRRRAGRTETAARPRRRWPRQPYGGARSHPGGGSGDAPRHPGHESGKARPELAETGGSVISLGLLAAGLLVSGTVLLEVARRLRGA